MPPKTLHKCRKNLGFIIADIIEPHTARALSSGPPRPLHTPPARPTVVASESCQLAHAPMASQSNCISLPSSRGRPAPRTGTEDALPATRTPPWVEWARVPVKMPFVPCRDAAEDRREGSVGILQRTWAMGWVSEEKSRRGESAYLRCRLIL